ncbi:MAG TPA: phosphoglycerate kinase [Candidatus Paceibacterota bacterium]|nr:phosphoglycerate kinase [Candidatus Paceibacterota bacterium]
MRSIKSLKNIKGKKVLVRVDFNLSIKNGRPEDDFRIKKSLPTINFLVKKGAEVILISHLGRGADTLAPVAKVLRKYVKRAKFVPEVLGPKTTKAVLAMKAGDVVLLENLRTDKREQMPDEKFAKHLAALADIYVNEAFPVSHRNDASITLLPKFLPHYAGFQLEKEVQNLSKALRPKHPFLFILGGAKFETKLPLIKKYLRLADRIFIGGALLNDFLRAEGYEVGKSLTDDSKLDKKIVNNKKIILPDYVIVKKGGKMSTKKSDAVKKDEMILDIGAQSAKMLAPYAKKAKLILWNGPLGKYEDGGASSTKKILKLVAASRAESIIGGGDTVALISEMKMEKKFTFVSTGGGATLDFLASGTLPGIKALS